MARRADHSKEELASLVVNTAEELIAEEGIDAFSARSLSRAIGYTAGTLYHHFKDLDDIVTQVNTRTLVGLARAFAEATPSADPRQMLHNYADAFLGYITLKRNLWNALFEFRRKPDQPVPPWYIEAIASLIRPVRPAGLRLDPFRRLARQLRPAQPDHGSRHHQGRARTGRHAHPRLHPPDEVGPAPEAHDSGLLETSEALRPRCGRCNRS